MSLLLLNGCMNTYLLKPCMFRIGGSSGIVILNNDATYLKQ
jgi:hypothetical protein